eukprot:4199113-Pleurochrysis_carterae.AAC.1
MERADDYKREEKRKKLSRESSLSVGKDKSGHGNFQAAICAPLHKQPNESNVNLQAERAPLASRADAPPAPAAVAPARARHSPGRLGKKNGPHTCRPKSAKESGWSVVQSGVSSPSGNIGASLRIWGKESRR